jgi:hypothetical protein
MDLFQKPIDLNLWLNADLIQQQNLLKKQFSAVLEEVGNSISLTELLEISSHSKGVKVSKGNDLLGFPYQVLDLIRDFDQDNGANIRILNWFGNGLFLTVLLGKNRRNMPREFLNLGFSYGLSENQWDYPDLILNKNISFEESEIANSKLRFNHWIREFEVTRVPTLLNEKLSDEVKKILGILSVR